MIIKQIDELLLVNCGTVYIQNWINNINNTFWNDTLQAFHILQQQNENFATESFLKLPIFYNK